MPARRVLVIEDDAAIRRGVVDALEASGYTTLEAARGDTGLAAAVRDAYDLLLLDLVLPGRDGLSVLEELRRVRPTTPVIILTARGEERDRVRGLRLGADDYVVKPFGMAELTARAKAALRRHKRGPGGDSVLTIERLRIDFAARQVSVDGKRLILTPKEYRLLQVLARHIGKVVTHQNLLTEVWGQSHLHDTHYLRIFVRKLRRKIEADPTRPRILLTELGVGYRLALPAETAPQALSS